VFAIRPVRYNSDDLQCGSYLHIYGQYRCYEPRFYLRSSRPCYTGNDCHSSVRRKSPNRHTRNHSLHRRNSQCSGPSIRYENHNIHHYNPSNRVSTSNRIQEVQPIDPEPSNIRIRCNPNIPESTNNLLPDNTVVRSKAGEVVHDVPVSQYQHVCGLQRLKVE